MPMGLAALSLGMEEVLRHNFVTSLPSLIRTNLYYLQRS